MNKFLILVALFISTALVDQVYAQTWNISTGSVAWDPEIVPPLNCGSELTGRFRMSFSGAMPSYPLCATTPSTVTLTLNNGATFVDGVVTGSLSTYFNWSIVNSTTIVGIQNGPIPLVANPFIPTVGENGASFFTNVMVPSSSGVTFNFRSQITDYSLGAPCGNLNDDTGDDIESTNATTMSCTVPIVLSFFDAVKIGKTSVLKWATQSEENAAYIEIERSINGLDEYITIGKMSANNAPSSYTFTDTKPFTGHNYYRLKLVDLDETFEYSNIKSVTFDEIGKKLLVYPNPFNQQFVVTGTYPGDEISLYGLDGRFLKKYFVRTTELSIDGTNLDDGIYIIEVKSGSDLKHFKVIKTN